MIGNCELHARLSERAARGQDAQSWLKGHAIKEDMMGNQTVQI